MAFRVANRKTTRDEALRFWRSIGSPKPADTTMEDWRWFSRIGTGALSTTYARLFIGKDETWMEVWAVFPDEAGAGDIVVEPGMSVIWQYGRQTTEWVDGNAGGLLKLIP